MKASSFGIAAGVLVVAIIVVTMACGGGNDRATTVPDQPIATSTPDASDEPEDASEGESESSTVSEDGLSRALLTISDMPTGWTTSPPETDEDEGFCGVEFESTALFDIEVGFQQSVTGPFAGHRLQAFPPGEAQRSFEAGVERASSCGEFTITNDDGTVNIWQVSPLSFPEVGDDTFAFRASTEVALFGSVTVDLVAFRRGDFISVLAFSVLGFGSPDPELAERLVRLADERLQDVR